MDRRKQAAASAKPARGSHFNAAQRRLRRLGCPEQAAILARFFKTGPGEYSGGDQFIGVRVPVIRKVATEFKRLPLDELETLLHSGFAAPLGSFKRRRLRKG